MAPLFPPRVLHRAPPYTLTKSTRIPLASPPHLHPLTPPPASQPLHRRIIFRCYSPPRPFVSPPPTSSRAFSFFFSRFFLRYRPARILSRLMCNCIIYSIIYSPVNLYNFYRSSLCVRKFDEPRRVFHVASFLYICVGIVRTLILNSCPTASYWIFFQAIFAIRRQRAMFDVSLALKDNLLIYARVCRCARARARYVRTHRVSARFRDDRDDRASYSIFILQFLLFASRTFCFFFMSRTFPHY